MVSAHLLALEKAAKIGFGKYIISATTPFSQEDLLLLNRDAYLKLNLVGFKTYEVYSLGLIIES